MPISILTTTNLQGTSSFLALPRKNPFQTSSLRKALNNILSFPQVGRVKKLQRALNNSKFHTPKTLPLSQLCSDTEMPGLKNSRIKVLSRHHHHLKCEKGSADPPSLFPSHAARGHALQHPGKQGPACEKYVTPLPESKLGTCASYENGPKQCRNPDPPDQDRPRGQVSQGC